MYSTFINLTDTDIILFRSRKRHGQKQIYGYLPKLPTYLNKFNSGNMTLNEFLNYIDKSLSPELNKIELIKPGDYVESDLLTFPYVYAIRILDDPKSIAVDIARLQNGNVYELVKDGKISGVINRFRNKTVESISGIESDDVTQVWHLTRHSFVYIVVDSEKHVDNLSTYFPKYLLIVIIFILAIVAIAYISSLYFCRAKTDV